MKHTVLLITTAVVLAGCSLQKQTAPEALKTETQTGSEVTSEFATVAAAIQAGKSARCTMAKKDATTVMEYMIKGKKMKMLTTASADKKQAGNMISDGEYMYTWVTDETKGIKMKVPSPEELQKMKDDATAQNPQLPDFTSTVEKEKYENLGYTVDCKVAEVAESEFIPPTTVTFSDISASMEKLKNITKQDAQQLTDEQQEEMAKQLKEAMGR